MSIVAALIFRTNINNAAFNEVNTVFSEKQDNCTSSLYVVTTRLTMDDKVNALSSYYSNGAIVLLTILFVSIVTIVIDQCEYVVH